MNNTLNSSDSKPYYIPIKGCRSFEESEAFKAEPVGISLEFRGGGSESEVW